MRISPRHKHFFIAGGSSGVDRALAIRVGTRGTNVMLLARDRTRLEEAKVELRYHTAFPDRVVYTVSAELSRDLSVLVSRMQEAEEACGPIDFLANCAGSASGLRFGEDARGRVTVAEFSRMMELNLLSAAHVTEAVLPGMLQRGQGGVVLGSPIAGVRGLYDFSAYRAFKFALVGLAQSLCKKARHRGVSVTVSFPTDINTPGFGEEQRTKAVETKLICASGRLHSLDKVAGMILNEALRGRFVSIMGLLGFLMVTTCAGMLPPNSLLHLASQVAYAGALHATEPPAVQNGEDQTQTSRDENQARGDEPTVGRAGRELEFEMAQKDDITMAKAFRQARIAEGEMFIKDDMSDVAGPEAKAVDFLVSWTTAAVYHPPCVMVWARGVHIINAGFGTIKAGQSFRPRQASAIMVFACHFGGKRAYVEGASPRRWKSLDEVRFIE
ncbi:short-chain dehydrogenase, putative [Ixodes scapularis]|uniref:Short-chain dehydrogenase, putative n=1 Tax=Ixodes scapularis TaxID=6945 RepID=B7Q3N1_IXOSC|nr:short-chain dehydrogenase, putative [Ixodes scapularis]|eukprot:XP_002411329.1 short-chain dehydrogenase, putative [Ixodes scapularis]